MNDKEFEQHCKAVQELFIQYGIKHSLAREEMAEIVDMLRVTLCLSIFIDEQPAAATTGKPN